MFKRKTPTVFNIVALVIMIVNEGLYVYDLYTDVIVIRFFLVRSSHRSQLQSIMQCSGIHVNYHTDCILEHNNTYQYWFTPDLTRSDYLIVSSLSYILIHVQNLFTDLLPYYLCAYYNQKNGYLVASILSLVFVTNHYVILSGLLTYWMRDFLWGLAGIDTEKEKEEVQLKERLLGSTQSAPGGL